MKNIKFLALVICIALIGCISFQVFESSSLCYANEETDNIAISYAKVNGISPKNMQNLANHVINCKGCKDYIIRI